MNNSRYTEYTNLTYPVIITSVIYYNKGQKVFVGKYYQNIRTQSLFREFIVDQKQQLRKDEWYDVGWTTIIALEVDTSKKKLVGVDLTKI